MMDAYLTLHPPAIDQWYSSRNRPLTGCTVLHSAENVFDEIGEDTGAEGVANYCRIRTTYGSYHDIVDSDSDIYLVDYSHGAYHDGTGSNNWALSLSFACRTTDWNRMTAAKRKAMLRNGAKAFLRQQAYRKAVGAPLTELRLITKAQSDAGMSGFTYHGWRDPGRRTDPGTIAPNLFPFDEFIAEILDLSGDDDMPSKEEFIAWVREAVPNSQIQPSPELKVGGDQARSLNSMVGRLLDDASSARTNTTKILAALQERGDLNLSDEDVAQIVAGLAASIPDALERMSDEDVQRIAEKSADVLAARLGA